MGGWPDGYLHNTVEELNSGLPRTNPDSSRVEDLNQGPPDFKSSALNHSTTLSPLRDTAKPPLWSCPFEGKHSKSRSPSLPTFWPLKVTNLLPRVLSWGREGEDPGNEVEKLQPTPPSFIWEILGSFSRAQMGFLSRKSTERFECMRRITGLCVCAHLSWRFSITNISNLRGREGPCGVERAFLVGFYFSDFQEVAKFELNYFITLRAIEKRNSWRDVKQGNQCQSITHGLLTKCEVKMAGYWPSSFFHVYGPRRSRGP